MIEDMVDTPLIMGEVRKFGTLQYKKGSQDGGQYALSRMIVGPVGGDMGG